MEEVCFLCRPEQLTRLITVTVNKAERTYHPADVGERIHLIPLAFRAYFASSVLAPQSRQLLALPRGPLLAGRRHGLLADPRIVTYVDDSISVRS